MKTTKDFETESANFSFLEDFVLSTKEWNEYEPGTNGFRVKTYNDSGNLVDKGYVLRNLDNTDEVLEDMQAVSSGYYTETAAVIKK